MKTWRMRRKPVLIAVASLTFATGISLYSANSVIENAASGKLFHDVKDIPFRKTGLLLGTSKYLGNGMLNPYYTSRIEATVELFKAHKITYLIISGDHGSTNYNEPQMMKDDLGKSGVDTSKAILDFAGFRTYDSVIRLREIFGQNRVTIISQKFHNERALYIASSLGIEAIGFNAEAVNGKQGLKTNIREGFARVKVYLDLLFHIQPKFYGPKIQIPE